MKRFASTLLLLLASLYSFGQFCPPTHEITCTNPCSKYKRRPFNCCSMAQISSTDATKDPGDYCCQYTCWAEYGCEYYGVDCSLMSIDPPGIEQSFFLRYGPNKLCRDVMGSGNCDGLYP